MWNDEDNNPYGTSFERRNSTASSSGQPTSPGSRESQGFIVLRTLQHVELSLYIQ